MTKTECYVLFFITWIILVASVAGSDALTSMAMKNCLTRLEAVVKKLEGPPRRQDRKHPIGDESGTISPQEKDSGSTVSDGAK